MKAYSLDLRRRAVELVYRGLARTTVIDLLGISLATLKRWLVLDQTTGDLTPRIPPGQGTRIAPDHHAELRALVQAHPDATLPEYATMWNATHTPPVSHWTIGRAIRALGLSRKKKR